MFAKPSSVVLALGVTVGALLLCTCASALADTVVVVSSKNPATALTQEQAVDVFLGKLTTLPGSGQPVLVDQPEGAPIREEFYSKLTGKSVAQLKAYWAKIIFTGKGQAPKTADTAALKKMIAENPNVIGYMDKAAVDSSVKVLFNVH